MEKREEFMVSGGGSYPYMRTAYFLIPSVTSIDGPVSSFPPDSISTASICAHKDFPFKVDFRGWRYPQENWKTWVDRMRALHYSTWRRAGILDAIINSTFCIHRSDDLIFSFVKKWCIKTNTFVFPWGEATLTLEDMMVLGGYSALGESVLSPAGGREMEEAVDNLNGARMELLKTKAKKADINAWMTKFMGNGSKIEHEAFLAYWLSRFVFPIFARDTVGVSILPIAVLLARGTKIALAPAVLACLYQSMSLLKAAVIAAGKTGTSEGCNSSLKVTVSAPLALVQVWVWERFPKMRPKPNSVGRSEPRLARWHNLKKVDIRDILLTEKYGAEDFQWRPYTRAVSSNSLTGMVYQDREYCALVDSDLDEGLEVLVRCLRTSELVSLEADCIQQYLPHRVAMQFGFDQDIPGYVERVNANPEIAWGNYSRPIRYDCCMYQLPCRLFEPGVTTRYLKWFNEHNFGCSGMTQPCEEGESSSEDSIIEVTNHSLGGKSKYKDLMPPFGFYSKWKTMETRASPEPGISKQFQDVKKANYVPREVSGRQSPLSFDVNNGAKVGLCGKDSCKGPKRKDIESSSSKMSDFNPLVSPPPGFAPKHRRVDAGETSIGSKRTGTKMIVIGDNGKSQSQVDARDQRPLSSSPSNGSIQEVTLLIEPVESEHKKTAAKKVSKLSWADDFENIDGNMEIGVSANHLKSSTYWEPGIGFEERVRNIEKLCARLKAGKLGFILMKTPKNL